MQTGLNPFSLKALSKPSRIPPRPAKRSINLTVLSCVRFLRTSCALMRSIHFSEKLLPVANCSMSVCNVGVIYMVFAIFFSLSGSGVLPGSLLVYRRDVAWLNLLPVINHIYYSISQLILQCPKSKIVPKIK